LTVRSQPNDGAAHLSSSALLPRLNPADPGGNAGCADRAGFADFSRILAIPTAEGLTAHFRDLRFWRNRPPN
jgi:hypothetical protein